MQIAQVSQMRVTAYPCAFALVGEQDEIASPSSMERRVLALRKLGVAVEFRRYPHLGHGFGVGVGTSADGWISDAVRFWEKHTKRA
jgi:acetyl esterase/lipase